LSAGSRPLLCFLIDAFRHDYLDTRETPFLAEVASAGTSRPLRTILGYSDSIRATAFTGAYPDELGYWMEYRFRPGGDPFRPFSSLGALDRIPSDLALRAMKLGVSRTVMPRLARSRGYQTLDLRHIPFGAMRFFDYTLREPMTSYGSLALPTFFDRLTEAGRRWSYLDSSKVGARGISDGLGAADPSAALLFVYLHHIDMASHLHGIDSLRFRSVVRQTDDRVRQITSSVRHRFGDVDVLLFSDHGMSRARAFRSLPELRRHPGFGRSFCFALDATMVRLWYLDDRDALRDELRAIVSSKLPGKFLEREDRRALHVDFSGRDYGDDIFLVDPGVIIFPNFHSYLRPKAMHAYHPDDPDQRGILVVSDGAVDLGEEAGLLDVHRLINRMAGLAQPTGLEV
jgi:Type I phosphodiesterase / nucleotide pyrophosphatase